MDVISLKLEVALDSKAWFLHNVLMFHLFQEARALLGRYEYQKGNLEAALHVFEGIDIAAVTPKMKAALSKIGVPVRRRSQNYATPQMSIHAVSLLLEAMFLKAKSLEALGRYKGSLHLIHLLVYLMYTKN